MTKTDITLEIIKDIGRALIVTAKLGHLGTDDEAMLAEYGKVLIGAADDIHRALGELSTVSTGGQCESVDQRWNSPIRCMRHAGHEIDIADASHWAGDGSLGWDYHW